MGTSRPDDAADRARRLAQQAWDRAREHLPAPVAEAAGRPADARLARQLQRDAEQARRRHEAAVVQHRSAVSRRERVLRRSRRALPAWGAVAGASVLAAAAAEGEASSLLVLLAGGGLLRVAVAARRLQQPPSVPPAPSPLTAPPPPPDPRSAAWPAVRRLERARAALRGLLPLIGPAGRAVAEEAWAAAAEADLELRWQAARLAAAEPYRGLDAATLAPLEAGVQAQERLVEAVADLVAAGADPRGAERVQDLTDRLHGLAAGLREVR